MGRKRLIDNLKALSNDIKNCTSYSVKYLSSPEVEDTVSIKGIRRRKVFSPVMRSAYKKQTKYELIIDSREKLSPNSKGRIYILNHRQADDIVLGVNTVKDSGWLVFGNPTLVYETLNGLGLCAYGVIVMERDIVESKHATYEKMKYILQNGGNIIIWSEGYWNLDDDGQKDEEHEADDHNSENWLIQDVHTGAVRLAQELGSSIVPAILHYDEVDGKKCYGIRGKEIFVTENDDVMAKKDEVVEYMTTLYYMLMAKYSTYNREDLEKGGETLKEQWEALKRELIADCSIPKIGYKLDIKNEKLIGKAKVVKPVTTNEEAFAHLNEIDYNNSNAFLLNKRFSGRRQ